jgi:hypothetical protein
MKTLQEIFNELDYFSRTESLFNVLPYKTVYIKNTSEKIVLRSVPPGDIFYAKVRGGVEYEIDYQSPSVVKAIEEAREITEEEYENF